MNDLEESRTQCTPRPPDGSGGRKRYSEPICPGVDPDAPGLLCPDCGCKHFRVIYTRAAARGRIRRRRECRYCGYRLTTMEKPTDDSEPE